MQTRAMEPALSLTSVTVACPVSVPPAVVPLESVAEMSNALVGASPSWR